jgi:hypothetical protein
MSVTHLHHREKWRFVPPHMSVGGRVVKDHTIEVTLGLQTPPVADGGALQALQRRRRHRAGALI